MEARIIMETLAASFLGVVAGVFFAVWLVRLSTRQQSKVGQNMGKHENRV